MSNQVKQMRGQIRQITKEVLPEILASELQQNNAKELRESMNKRMDEITKNLMDYLKGIEERQKDFQSYVIRQLSPPIQKKEVTPDEKA